MAEHKVFVTRRHIVPDAIAYLEKHFDVDVWEERDAPSREVLRQKATECQGFLTEITDIVDREFLDGATALKIVANRAVGMDNIDIPEATRHGVLVSNTPGVLHESCADFALGLMLSLARNITYGDRRVRAHEWKIFDQIPYLGTDVYGATLGIVGLGLIGTAVAKRAKGFDMRVLYHSRTRKPDAERDLGVEWIGDLDSLLVESDFVSLHLPLMPETRHYIGERELKLMKPGAFLINASRGGTVDPRALYEALSQGVIAGAALDVTEPEPIPFDDPLLSLPNIVFTPHISSASTATVRKMGMMAADNIRAALMGDDMPSCVNPEAVSG